MLRLEGCAPNPTRWQEILRQLDGQLALSIEFYTNGLGGLNDQEIAAGHRQFAGFGSRGGVGGGDPDYSIRAVPIVYALRFVPQRMATIVSALDLMTRNRSIRPLKSILDLSSGIDPVSLALSYTGMTGVGHEVLCIEESDTMLAFASTVECDIRRAHRSHELLSFLKTSNFQKYDAVFLSYAFDYVHESAPGFLDSIADALAARLNSGGFILYVGPQGKRRISTHMSLRLKSVGLEIQPLDSGWVDHLRKRYSMPRLQTLYNESVASARAGGLEYDLYAKLLNPYTGRPSWIFTHTTDSQCVWSAHRL